MNNCPLDPEYPNRYMDSNDPEKKCGYAKIRRIRISEQFPGILKFNGMTQTEYKYKQAWDNLPDEEKQRRIQRINQVNMKRFGNSDLKSVSEIAQE